MDPGSSAAATGTLYGALALVVIALVPFARDLLGVFRAWIEHRWTTTDAADDADDDEDDRALKDVVGKDVEWLQRRIATLELQLARCRREGERRSGEIEQLRGEIEFLVEQLQDAIEERDLAQHREARLRSEQGRS